MGWNLKEKYKNLFGEKYLTNKNVKSVIKNSKLIVCTYPETTFRINVFWSSNNFTLFTRYMEI